jgi:rubrerythrin
MRCVLNARSESCILDVRAGERLIFDERGNCRLGHCVEVEMIEQNIDLTVGEILESAIKIEKRVADLYAIFKKRFSYVPGMSDFWGDLRRDEISHMGELRVVYESMPAEKLGVLESRAISLSVHRAVISVEDVCLCRIQTLDDAYEIARNLEFSEINAIFEYLTMSFAAPSSPRDLITYQIDEHQQKLVDFDVLYGDKDWRLQFPIQPE